MKQNLPLLFLFLSISIFSQNIISGKVVNEINLGIPSVLVVNINTDQKTYTDFNGDFSIPAKTQDEIRFLKPKFERAFYKIERGEANPTLEVLEKLLDVLGLEILIRVKQLNI